MSEKKNATEDVMSLQDETSEQLRQPIQRLANQILEECIKQNWSLACVIVEEFLHYCLGRGYYALAKTIKKLRWALEPEVDEYRTRKYLLRMMWLLARVKREKNHFYLIYNDKKTCLLKKHEMRKQKSKQESMFLESQFQESTVQENSFSAIAQRLAADAIVTYMETDTDAHAKLQPPHVKFAVASSEIVSQHKHVEVPKPMGDRAHKKSSFVDPQNES